jgi:hypothetical protein
VPDDKLSEGVKEISSSLRIIDLELECNYANFSPRMTSFSPRTSIDKHRVRLRDLYQDPSVNLSSSPREFQFDRRRFT